MRTIRPFNYWHDRASQLYGYGGEQPSPDPRYCFHTAYEDVRPGRATFSLKLLGSRATRGELSLRVHAFRPDAGGEPVFVASNRLELEDRRYEDLSVAIPFYAVKGVHYALYGYFAEPTDLTVDEIDVLLDETDREEGVEIEPPLSTLAEPAGAAEAGPATGLVYHDAVSLARPVSQDCSWSHLEPGGTVANRMARWREAVCLGALTAYGIERAGLDGWIAGESNALLHEALSTKGFAVFLHYEAPARDSGEFADFVVWLEGPSIDEDAAARWAALHAWLDRLKIGGVAVIGVRYTPHGSLARNEIRQWVFRLIGLGFSVAPLAFADRSDLAVDEAGMSACCLIVRRQ